MIADRFLDKLKRLPFNQLLLILLSYFCLTAYFPFVGRFFFGDDFFRLIDNSKKMLGILDIGMDGFFRPINHLSFYICIKLFGYKPYFYGVFNFTLFFANLILAYFIFKKICKSPHIASIIALCWGLNFKIAQSTLLMMVGRTELLWVFFFFCGIVSLLYTKNLLASLVLSIIFFSLSLLSKETAIMIPIATPIILRISGVEKKKFYLSTLINILLLIIYFYLRKSTNAWDTSTAPDLYQYNFSILHICKKTSYYFFRVYFLSLIPALLMIIYNFKNFKIKLSCYKIQAFFILLISILFLMPTLLIQNSSNLYAYVSLPFLICAFLIPLKDSLQTNRNLIFLMIIFTVLVFPFSQKKFIGTSLRSNIVSTLAEHIDNYDPNTSKATIITNDKFDEINLEYALKVKKISHNKLKK